MSTKQQHRNLWKVVLFASLVAVAAGIGPSIQAADKPPAEVFRYDWKLSSFLGVGGLFLPTRGVGSLTFAPQAGEFLESELYITSPARGEGEYFRYGARIDISQGRTLEAWSGYLWNGEEKKRHGNIEEVGVVDVASAIYRLRSDPPTRPKRMVIWSDGKTYPVEVIPVGDEKRKIAGRKLVTRHLSVRGLKEPNARSWKGRLDLWIAKDPAGTPVEILVKRPFVGIRLRLQDAPG